MTSAVAASPAPVRRRKRSECERRILAAARAAFTERGYDGATTREIADRAQVSETLIYRYFGSKAGLFDQILFAPVGGMMDSLLASRGSGRIDGDPEASTRDFLNSLLAFADMNQPLLAAYAARTMTEKDSAEAPMGLTRFYELAAAEIRRIHAARGTEARVAPSTAVRLSLGMVIASILFERWLFPEGPPSRIELVESLARMLVAANIGEVVVR